MGTPEQPEPLTTLRRLRRFNFAVLWYSGGMSNQPHIWLAELHAAVDGEIDFERIQTANLKLKMEAQDGNSSQLT